MLRAFANFTDSDLENLDEERAKAYISRLPFVIKLQSDALAASMTPVLAALLKAITPG